MPSPICRSLVCLLVLAGPLVAQEQEAVDLSGRWSLGYLRPGVVERRSFEMVLHPFEGETATADIALDGRRVPFAGTFDPETGRLSLEAHEGSDSASVELELESGAWRGTARVGDRSFQVDAQRAAADAVVPPLEVDFPIERPRTVFREGLPPEAAEPVDRAIEALMESELVIGLSAAFVVDGEVKDLRGFGWKDYHRRIPVDEATSYRWASISKPLTAVVALQMAEEGELDLDADVRELVPEFDMKKAITSRQLLCHQAGVTHYGDMRVRTVREYEVEHPWADRILALDMFDETALLFEPGTAYLYSTPGYSVLGAVIQRAAGDTYAAETRRRVCEPLGMTSMRPDYAWEEIPARTRGYERFGDRVVDAGDDDDISWKLPAGGWTSTVEDLARFGAGLMGGELLSVESQLAMWEPQATSDGTRTPYGLGIGVSELDGERLVHHSGGQKKTSTFLLCCPGYGVAVALMCNTEGTPLSGLARELLKELLETI